MSSELTLYNTMSLQKEVLKPINSGKIGMYIGGITAYDFSHIGHARAAVSFDVLYRYLRHLGYEVTYVRNFTDVDDKVIDRANKCGKSPLDLSSRFCEEYLVDMAALQCLLPTHQPRVSDHMDHIINMIQTVCLHEGDLYLSPRFDIHGGGADHENEIAQTCAACEDSGATYWLHNGHVNNNNVKMGKALDNYFTIREVTAKYHPLALRHFLMSAQYRSPLNYSVLQLETSSDALYYVYQTLDDLVEALLPYREAICEDGGKADMTAQAKEIVKEVQSEFESKLSDDLNTAHVLVGAFQDAMKFINVSITKLKKMQKKPRMSLVVSLVEVEKAVREVLDVLGLLTTLSYADFLKEMKQKALVRAELGEEEVLQNLFKTFQLSKLAKTRNISSREITENRNWNDTFLQERGIRKSEKKEINGTEPCGKMFSHRTPDDGMEYMLWEIVEKTPSQEVFAKNWRKISGCVRNQRSHDNCWTYAGTDVFSAHRVITEEDETFRTFSARYLTFFASKMMRHFESIEGHRRREHHCHGFTIAGTLRFIKENGVPEEDPRDAETDFSCISDAPEENPSNMYKLPAEVEIRVSTKLEDLYDMLLHQSVGADLHFFHPEFTDIGSDIYEGPKSEESIYSGLHTVVIVRVKRSKGKLVAIVKSSHGTEKGRKGYMKVSLTKMILGLGQGNEIMSPSFLVTNFTCPVIPRALDKPKSEKEGKKERKKRKTESGSLPSLVAIDHLPVDQSESTVASENLKPTLDPETSVQKSCWKNSVYEKVTWNGEEKDEQGGNKQEAWHKFCEKNVTGPNALAMIKIVSSL